MTKQTLIFRAFALTVPATLLLSACGETPSDEAGSGAEERDIAAEEGGSATGQPDAQPTASIFGPEAELPAPEDQEIPASLPLKLSIGFPDGGDALDADAIAALEDALPKLLANKSATVTLGGHSDAGGNDAANMTASEKRGLAVAEWLIDRGVSDDRINVIAFGEQNPVQPNALPDGSPNELGRAANRRVDITVSKPAKPENSKSEEPQS